MELYTHIHWKVIARVHHYDVLQPCSTYTAPTLGRFLHFDTQVSAVFRIVRPVISIHTICMGQQS